MGELNGPKRATVLPVYARLDLEPKPKGEDKKQVKMNSRSCLVNNRLSAFLKRFRFKYRNAKVRQRSDRSHYRLCPTCDENLRACQHRGKNLIGWQFG